MKAGIVDAYNGNAFPGKHLAAALDDASIAG